MGDNLDKYTPKLSGRGTVDLAIFKAHLFLNRIIPPQQRRKLWLQFKSFAATNPKLTTFLLANIALSGPPLVLFVVFTLTVLLITLLTGLIIGIVGAVLFTGFMVLLALFVVLPMLFFTTFVAMFLAVWGIGIYYLVQRIPKEKRERMSSAVGERVGSITSGSLDVLSKGVKEAEVLVLGDGSDISAPNEELSGAIETSS